MKSFEHFVFDSAQGGHVNLIFEQGMYFVAEDLEKLLRLFEEAQVPFEVIGGVAVNAHLLAAAQRSRSFVTRDVDVLMHRSDLDRIKKVATQHGYQTKRMIGGYALIGEGQHLSEAIHILFVGEKPKSSYPASNPQLNPQPMSLFDLTLPVAPLRDLLVLKLNSLRPKDIVHLEILDEVGFITREIEAELPSELQERLTLARKQFEYGLDDEAGEFDRN